MSSNPVTLGPDSSVGEALALMVEKNIGCVYVVDKMGALLGVFTERELIEDLVKHKEVRCEVRLHELMSTSVMPISPETSVKEAAMKMIDSKVRLAVTKDNKIVGVVTSSDLVRAFSSGAENRSIADVATRKVKTLDASNTVFDAVHLMHEKRIGSVAVMKDGRPYGLFTERDLIKFLAQGAKERLIDIRLEEAASRPLITAKMGITAREVASIMESNKIKRLPLTQGDVLVAIITARDLVETYVSTGLPTVATTASD
ncbi:MAG: CBS domain-containing protein [Thaumarchaeota archaeon]|nr:CBS domain-containing protein [Nitrososphaerota archaeon]